METPKKSKNAVRIGNELISLDASLAKRARAAAAYLGVSFEAFIIQACEEYRDRRKPVVTSDRAAEQFRLFVKLLKPRLSPVQTASIAEQWEAVCVAQGWATIDEVIG